MSEFRKELQDKCAWCFYYVQSKHRPIKGYCRRHAPVLDIKQEGNKNCFPNVCGTFWCGDFQIAETDDLVNRRNIYEEYRIQSEGQSTPPVKTDNTPK